MEADFSKTNIKIEVTKSIKETLKVNELWLDQFYKLYSLNILEPSTIDKAIENQKKIYEKIIIPEPLKSVPVPIRSKPNFVNKYNFTDEEPRFKQENIYEGTTQNEVNKLKNKKKNIAIDLNGLKTIKGIVEHYISPNGRKNIKKTEISEGQLIEALFDIVIKGKLKSYSLRKFEVSLKQNNINRDHSYLGNLFNKQNFQYALIAAIMRKKDLLKKELEIDNLDSFKNWFNNFYMEAKKTYQQNKSGEITSLRTDIKSGKSGIDNSKYEDEFYENLDLD